MKSKTTKNILLITLIVTILIVAFCNFSTFSITVEAFRAGKIPNTGLIGDIGSMLSWGNMILFAFIIFFYGYKKRNLWLILLPYLGSIIFGLMKLLEKESVDEEAN